MEQRIVKARDLSPGDYVPYMLPDGNSIEHTGPFNLGATEKVISVGINPVRDTVDVQSVFGKHILAAMGVSGKLEILVYRETDDEDQS